MWPIDKPADYPKNARKWSAKAVAKVAASIREFGWRQPVVVDTAGVIVIGHLRRAAGKSIGLTECPVHIASDLSPAKIRALRLADNRTAQEAEWDLDILASEFADLKNFDLDLGTTGFDLREINKFSSTPEIVEDDAPPVPEVPTSANGDLWLLGSHRLLCGDSTEADQVSAVMMAGLADMVFTDPPYGVNYSGGTTAREKLAGDDSVGLYGICCKVAASNSKHGAPLYLWHAGTKAYAVHAALEGAGYTIRCEIMWNKQLAQFGSLGAQYKQKHEPCYYCFRGAPPWFGPSNEVTVWDVDRARVNEFHPTQKPVALAARAIGNSSKSGDVVLDLFGGSGSTLIACEQTQRICRMVELSPAYCDVIVQRWQNLTGEQATLDGDGQTFQEVSDARRKAR